MLSSRDGNALRTKALGLAAAHIYCLRIIHHMCCSTYALPGLQTKTPPRRK